MYGWLETGFDRPPDPCRIAGRWAHDQCGIGKTCWYFRPTLFAPRAHLGRAGYIKGYHANIDAREMGFEVQVFAMVRLHSQAEGDLSAFEARCRAWPLVRECHMLNGEIDFILKCVAPDLSTFQSFLTGDLLKAENVASVKTSLVIRGAKDEPGVPFEVLEERLNRNA